MKLPIAPPKSLVIVLLAATVLISLTACRAEINLSVDEEGKGKIEIIGAVNDAILSMAQLGGEDPLGDFLSAPTDELEAEGLEGARIEPYSEAGYTGIRIQANFDPRSTAIASLSDDDSILGNLTKTVGIGQFNFTRTEQDDGWVVELNQTTDSSITDGLDGLTGDIPFDIGELELPFILSLELPGEYIEHNADREVDGVLIWDSNLLDGIDVYARTRDPGFQFAVGPIIITSLFVLIGGGIVTSVVVSRYRRRRREEEDAAMEAEERESPTTIIEIID